MLKGLRQLEEGTAVFTPQDATKVVECRMFEKQDGRIQWGSSAETIHNLVRAAQPWPIAHCHMNGEVYRIHATERIEGNAMAEPGTIEHVMKDRLVVATGDGRLAITQIQAPGKRMMDVGDFLRGHRLEPGASFTDIA
jgi:methionyl-tRNA formyltransferase